MICKGQTGKSGKMIYIILDEQYEYSYIANTNVHKPFMNQTQGSTGKPGKSRALASNLGTFWIEKFLSTFEIAYIKKVKPLVATQLNVTTIFFFQEEKNIEFCVNVQTRESGGEKEILARERKNKIGNLSSFKIQSFSAWLLRVVTLFPSFCKCL